jgi:D-amino-acid dehydrogenase
MAGRSISHSPDVLVVGAGIVGACIAHALVKRGARVLLLDADAPGRGCSYGNSGALSVGSVAPLAMPGIVRSVPRMLLDRDGPLRIHPAYLPRALPWLLRFVASATPAGVEAAARVLRGLHAGAIEGHVALAAQIGAPELILQRGHLHLYPDADALAKDRAAWDLRTRSGVQFEVLDRAGIEALEPRIGPRYRVGVFLRDHASVVNPLRYVERIVAAFQALGGRFERDRIRLSGRDGALRCEGRERYTAANVVVAAGIASRGLLRPVGVRVPLLSQRGYHVTFRGAAPPISRTVVLADRKVFATPMEDGLRIGGTVEIASPARPPDLRRSAQLARLARETFGDLEGREEHWMGNRPCTPDSLPIIGRAPRVPSLWLAVGHGHLGLTQSVPTAARIADSITAGSA